MLEMITPITNRTKNDVDRVKELFDKGWNNFSDEEKEEWISGLKGSANRSDFERIENNVQLLSDVLELDLQTYFGKVPDVIKEDYINTLLYNVDSIRNAYAKYDDTPQTPKKANVYTELNDIERILLDIYEILNANFFNYCGELYAGEVLGLPV